MTNSRAPTRRKHVLVVIPRHVSLQPPRGSNVLYLACYRPGVVWRGLAPILLQAPRPTAQRFLQCLYNTSKPNGSFDLTDENVFATEAQEKMIHPEDERSLVYHRVLPMPKRRREAPQAILLWIQPPLITAIDHTFSFALIKLEHALLQMRTLSAWYATLGGGYFFCRRLTFSLQLARHQRKLALILGNAEMARQCSVNEAYNLLYAGKFQDAHKVLSDLYASTNDSVTRNQCLAANLLGKRLIKFGRQLQAYHHVPKQYTETVDDYQRIRIVEGY
jgi:hypothetical protein